MEFCQSKSIKQSSFQVGTSNVLVDRMKRSERDVIKEWLENIFKTWERTNDLAIKEFKLTQLNHDSPAVENGGIVRQNGGPTPAPVSNGGRNGGGGTQQGQEARDQDRLVSPESQSERDSDMAHWVHTIICILYHRLIHLIFLYIKPFT